MVTSRVGHQRGELAFPKSVRLRRRAEFVRVQERGVKVSADSMLVVLLPHGRADSVTRAGFTVSSKVGNAVVRNRIRRRLRQLFRLRRLTLPQGLDVVFIARHSAATAEWPALERAFDKVVAEAGRRFPRP